jgi:hypothetical protein
VTTTVAEETEASTELAVALAAAGDATTEQLLVQALLSYGTLEFYRGWNAARALAEEQVYKPADPAQMERYRRMSASATAALKRRLRVTPEEG